MIRAASALVAAVAAASLLTSCASPGRSPEVRAALEAAPVCCADYSEMKFRSITPGKGNIVIIDSKSPTFVFPKGKSHFAAIRLPQAKHAQRLRVAVPIDGPSSQSSIFLPRITLLDANHQPLYSVVAPRTWNYDRNVDGHLLATVALDGSERFVVVHTDLENLGQKLKYTYTVNHVYGGGAAPIVAVPQTYTVYPVFAPIGSFTVRVEKIDPKR